jgi:hypothetical protein
MSELNLPSVANAPAALVPALVATELVGGSAGDAASPVADAAVISAEASAMLAAEQSALAMSVGMMPS